MSGWSGDAWGGAGEELTDFLDRGGIVRRPIAFDRPEREVPWRRLPPFRLGGGYPGGHRLDLASVPGQAIGDHAGVSRIGRPDPRQSDADHSDHEPRGPWPETIRARAADSSAMAPGRRSVAAPARPSGPTRAVPWPRGSSPRDSRPGSRGPSAIVACDRSPRSPAGGPAGAEESCPCQSARQSGPRRAALVSDPGTRAAGSRRRPPGPPLPWPLPRGRSGPRDGRGLRRLAMRRRRRAVEPRRVAPVRGLFHLRVRDERFPVLPFSRLEANRRLDPDGVRGLHAIDLRFPGVRRSLRGGRGLFPPNPILLHKRGRGQIMRGRLAGQGCLLARGDQG